MIALPAVPRHRAVVRPAVDAGAVRLWLAAPWRMLALWHRRARYRADLLRLLRVGTYAYMIEDIGLTAAAAMEEAAKPFWRA